MKKGTILVCDDNELNREIMNEMLKDDFNLFFASDGEECLKLIDQYRDVISLLLLDIMMPVKDGFDVLKAMNENDSISAFPVIIMSADGSDPNINQAYKLGTTDYLTKPFTKTALIHRVMNVIAAFAQRKALEKTVISQIFSKERDNAIMVSILANVVEFHNGESGLHVLHINTIVEIILNKILSLCDQYKISNNDISLICMASSLHDIGKIAIPSSILNKPGRLTPAEFEIMKTHTTKGAEMLEGIKIYQDEPILRYAYEIVRWHHEKWDGKGYPDGLKGEEIPIYVQAVSLADCYDALISERVYKKAYSHEEAYQMIVNGECGQFNPLVIEAFTLCKDEIRKGIRDNSLKMSLLTRSEKTARETLLAISQDLIK